MKLSNNEVTEIWNGSFGEAMSHAPIPFEEMSPREQIDWERMCSNLADMRTQERVTRGEWASYLNARRLTRDPAKLPDPDSARMRTPRRYGKRQSAV